MSAKDIYHNVVKTALEKDGWNITADPLIMKFGEVDLFIDLGAEKVISAEKNGEKIAVEIKSFVGTSLVSEYHSALGQFINYKIVLQEMEPDRTLYVAITKKVYQRFLNYSFFSFSIKKNNLYIIVFDPTKEEIIQWIK
ncbi:MAG: XisH family protein [Leptospiraceae bacterium]|nr:XisH family protein [Leptospiraceae bacterium]MCP5494568.1 XisH family protein [Leptospiraceae bacterium]